MPHAEQSSSPLSIPCWRSWWLGSPRSLARAGDKIPAIPGRRRTRQMAGWGWMEGAGGDGEGNDDKDAAKNDKGLGFSSRELGEKQNAGKRHWCWLLFGCGGLCCSPPPWRGPHGQALSPLIKLCHHKRRWIPMGMGKLRNLSRHPDRSHRTLSPRSLKGNSFRRVLK